MGKRHNKNRDIVRTSPSSEIVAFVAAYGSLMSKSSLMATINRAVGTQKIASIHGFRRSWLASMRNNPNYQKFWVKDIKTVDDTIEEVLPIFKPCYLDVSVDPESTLIAPLIPLTENELKILDAREAGYTRVDVTEFVNSVGGDVHTGIIPIYLYMGRPEFRIRLLDCEAKIPYPYLEMCIKSSKEHSQECHDNFHKHMEGYKIAVQYNIKLGDNQEY